VVYEAERARLREHGDDPEDDEDWTGEQATDRGNAQPFLSRLDSAILPQCAIRFTTPVTKATTASRVVTGGARVGKLWGSLTPKRADFGGLGRITAANEKKPKASE
jgi:hypothetical protein